MGGIDSDDAGLIRVRDFRQKLVYLLVCYHLACRADGIPRAKGSAYFEFRNKIIPDANRDECFRTSFLNRKSGSLQNLDSLGPIEVEYERTRHALFVNKTDWELFLQQQKFADLLGCEGFGANKAIDKKHKALMEQTIVGHACERTCKCRSVELDRKLDVKSAPEFRALEYSCPDEEERWTPATDRAVIRIARLWGFCWSWTKPGETESIDAWDAWPDDSRSACRDVWMTFAGPTNGTLRGADFATFKKAYDRLRQADPDARLRTNPSGHVVSTVVNREKRRKSLTDSADEMVDPSKMRVVAGESAKSVEGFDLTIDLRQGSLHLNALAAPRYRDGDKQAVNVRVIEVTVSLVPGPELQGRFSGPPRELHGSVGGQNFRMVRFSTQPQLIFRIKAENEGAVLPEIYFWTDQDAPAILKLSENIPLGATFKALMEMHSNDLCIPSDTGGAGPKLIKKQLLNLFENLLDSGARNFDVDEIQTVFQQTYRLEAR